MITRILALDLATHIGWALGDVGGVPRFGTESMGKTSSSPGAVFGNCVKWTSEFLRDADPRPDIIVIESLLPDEAVSGHTNKRTKERLAGLHGVVRGVAHCRGVFQVATYPTQEVRRHFIGIGTLKREKAKVAVMEHCRTMGWDVQTDDEADALALWHFACCLIDPSVGIRATPMFFQKVTAEQFRRKGRA
jgi:Holliday junction resolvasome RuvABC endonuclease subunit